MKLAIASTGDNPDAQVDPRFGRCRWFVFADSEHMSYEAMENRASAAGHGAGIEAAQVIANAGCDGVVSAHFGPNAAHALSQGGIRMYQFSGGTVRQAAEAVLAGDAPEMTGADVDAHHGAGSGR